MNKLPILYSFVRCPYAMRARMSLLAANINCELREIDLKNKSPYFLEISAKGTVPVLCLEDGMVIDESLDIVNYALGANIPSDQKQKTMQIIDDNDTEFVNLVKICKYPKRYPDDSPEFSKNQIEEKFLSKYESMLEGQSFFFGDKKSFLDIAILPFIRQFSIVYPDWFFASKYKNVISWLNLFTKEDQFTKIIMRKNRPWQENDQPVFLLNS